ncbi:MAG: AMP-binding protein [Firmicutes bacterium]|nr:AMP-binding protein [Bacillota bacterium]
MSLFLQYLNEYTQQEPNTPVLYDEIHTKGLGYAEINDLSGRIYSWLKTQNIGKEDFVLINLPRSVQPVVAMIGVWKAGAAWVMVEDTYAPDRIEFIRNDCGCKVEINAENWEHIMNEKPLPDYVDCSEHDAAFAIYTSGSTGTPKGVLHEWGHLDHSSASIRRAYNNPFSDKKNVAVISPLNFVASVNTIMNNLSLFNVKVHIVSYTTVKNPETLAQFFIDHNITSTFLTPSYARIIGKKIASTVKVLYVGSEPANGLYIDGVKVYNIYGASETAGSACMFEIDKPYDTCPIGKPLVEDSVRLVDENGEPVPDGETGELLFKTSFVRGYINLPEETKRAFVDGYYHSGDLAYKNSNGDYVLLGRKGDMIKINGNRIEPAEIEAAIKQVLGIDWAAARGFEENDRSYLCAYYNTDVDFDTKELRKELQKRLPYYMIPSCFIKIDSIPLKANGKFDRTALPKPNLEDFHSDYVAPRNNIEEKICHAMETVLKLKRIGIHDDFYEMGGDSLASMEMIVESGLEGLSAGEVFRGRTPEEIAKLYLESLIGKIDADIQNESAIQREHQLTVEQNYMLDYQLYSPGSTMYNLFGLMKCDLKTIDMQKMAEALGTAIQNHPALLTHYRFNEDGEPVQYYAPETFVSIRVEKLTEFEFRFVKNSLVYPYKVIGGTLYRCRVFETEKSGYIFFDVHHSVFDGTSLQVFWNNVSRAYNGEELQKDYYYQIMEQREVVSASAIYKASKQYFEKRYDGVDWSCYPKTDHTSRENKVKEVFSPIDIDQLQMKTLEKVYQLSRNEFFIAAAALAISIYNNEQNIRLSWIYNGRENEYMMSTVGLLFRALPVGLRLIDNATLRDIYADVRDQVQKGIEHSNYPYVDMRNQVAENEPAYLLYQRNIRDSHVMGELDVESVDLRWNESAAQAILDLEILDGESGLGLLASYAASFYEDESISRFQKLFLITAKTLSQHHSQADICLGDIRKEISKELEFDGTENN